MLAFEPPHFGPAIRRSAACVAAGLSGPRARLRRLGARYVLGVRMLDGKGDDPALRRPGDEERRRLRRVARCWPARSARWACCSKSRSRCCRYRPPKLPCGSSTRPADAIAAMNAWAGKPLPISATAWHDGRLHVRLSGARRRSPRRSSRSAANGSTTRSRNATGRTCASNRPRSLRRRQTLWRLSLKPTTPPLDLPGAQLIEWNGALRWLATNATPGARARRQPIRRRSCNAVSRRRQVRRRLSSIAAGAGGDPAQAEATFDPRGIFNPGACS